MTIYIVLSGYQWQFTLCQSKLCDSFYAVQSYVIVYSVILYSVVVYFVLSYPHWQFALCCPVVWQFVLWYCDSLLLLSFTFITNFNIEWLKHIFFLVSRVLYLWPIMTLWNFIHTYVHTYILVQSHSRSPLFHHAFHHFVLLPLLIYNNHLFTRCMVCYFVMFFHCHAKADRWMLLMRLWHNLFFLNSFFSFLFWQWSWLSFF